MEITRRVLALTGRDASLVRHVEDRLGHDRRYALDTTRLRALGWEPRIGFEEGLAATVSGTGHRRDWWEPIKSGEYRAVLRGAVREPLGDGEEWVCLADPVNESMWSAAASTMRCRITVFDRRRRPRTRHAAGQRGSSAERSSREAQRGSSERRRLRSRRPHRASSLAPCASLRSAPASIGSIAPRPRRRRPARPRTRRGSCHGVVPVRGCQAELDDPLVVRIGERTRRCTGGRCDVSARLIGFVDALSEGEEAEDDGDRAQGDGGPAQPSSSPDSPLGLTQSRTREQEPDDRDDQELDRNGTGVVPRCGRDAGQATRATGEE